VNFLAQIWYSPRFRALFHQVSVAIAVTAFGGYLFANLAANLERQGIASGFGFLNTTAGFSIVPTLISYDETRTYGRAFVVALCNTLLVSVLGVVGSTFFGFLMGIARLSTNWLLAKLAGIFVECMRNVPLLLILFFFYFGILRNLPAPDNSISLGASIFINNRGLFLPTFSRGTEGAPDAWNWSYPVFEGFDFVGGMVITPEFIALLLGLIFYTAGFIAEIVRAGILAVSRGQSEAAHALGLSESQSLRFVIIPQAMRVIIPPLTSQYLNLAKNSSLAAAIGYPDIVQVFAGTVLSQSGQAVEIIAMTMGVYLAISLAISMFMNIYNQRMALQERT